MLIPEITSGPLEHRELRNEPVKLSKDHLNYKRTTKEKVMEISSDFPMSISYISYIKLYIIIIDYN